MQEQYTICLCAVGSEDSQNDVPLELTCDHASWCSVCLLRALRKNSECPLCRSPVAKDLWADLIPRRSRRRSRFINLLCVDQTRTRIGVFDIQHTVVRTIKNEELSDEEFSDLELDETPNPERLKDIDDASLVFLISKNV